MVKIDRGFIGVLLIAVVISTVFMGFITVEKADQGIEIIKNKYPGMIRTSVQERHTFVTNVIARKPYEQVKLKFSVLRLMEPVFADKNVTDDPDATLDEIAAEITPIKTCLSAGKSSPVGFEREVLEFNANGTNVEALMLDFGLVVAAGQSVPDISSAPTSYILWRDDEGNLTYYQGSSDFFFARNDSIESLVVSYNDNETTYRSAKEVTGSIDVPTIAEGPKMGMVVYEKVEKDDRMYVMFAVNSLSAPAHEGMIQLVRVYGNDELVTFEANMISS
jgi:hypothetical protein